MERRDSNMTLWLWQILAIVGSTLSTVAIGVLLVHYDSQPVFDWGGVTLNAIVAVFSAVAKALLVFALAECLGQAKWIWTSQTKRPLNDINTLDEASRGPLGSLKFFGHPVARSFISIGAIAVVFSAVIDPFVQLTIGKKDALTYKEDPLAQIAYAKRYSKGAFSTVLATTLPSTDGNTYRSTNVDADFSMKSAVFYGMSEPESAISQHMKYSCYSGNCTWEEYESLAICSACNDLTKRLVSEKKSGSPLSIYLSITNPGTMTGTYTKYRLPNGLEGDSSVAMTAFGTGNESDTVTFKDRDTLIWAMTIMNFTTTGPSPETKVTAAECGLWYCVNKYTSSFEKGNLTEIITPAQSRRNPQSWQWIQEKSTDNITVEPSNSIMYGISASVPRTDLQIGNGFNLSKAAVYGISDFMNKTFSTRERTGRINAYAYNNVTFQPTVVQQLYTAPNLTTLFQSLAMSMTNNIRQNSDNSTVKVGQAGTYQILIRTRP